MLLNWPKKLNIFFLKIKLLLETLQNLHFLPKIKAFMFISQYQILLTQNISQNELVKFRPLAEKVRIFVQNTNKEVQLTNETLIDPNTPQINLSSHQFSMFIHWSEWHYEHSQRYVYSTLRIALNNVITSGTCFVIMIIDCFLSLLLQMSTLRMTTVYKVRASERSLLGQMSLFYRLVAQDKSLFKKKYVIWFYRRRKKFPVNFVVLDNVLFRNRGNFQVLTPLSCPHLDILELLKNIST